MLTADVYGDPEVKFGTIPTSITVARHKSLVESLATTALKTDVLRSSNSRSLSKQTSVGPGSYETTKRVEVVPRKAPAGRRLKNVKLFQMMHQARPYKEEAMLTIQGLPTQSQFDVSETLSGYRRELTPDQI